MLAIEKKITLFACLAQATLSLCANDADYSGYVYLKGNDTLNSNSWRAKKNWSDGKAPSSDKDYYVPPETLLCFKRDSNDNTKRIWQGGRLAIAGTFQMEVTASYGNAPYIPDLTICPGGMIMWTPYGPFSTSDSNEHGVVRIEGTAENPSVLSHHDANVNESVRTYTLNGLFKGGASNVLVLERPEVNYAGDICHPGCKCYVPANTFADFPGTFRIQGGTMFMAPSKNTIFNWPDTLLSVCDGARLNLFHDSSSVKDATTNAYLRALSVDGGSVCWKYVENSNGRFVFPLVNLSEGINFAPGSEVMIAAARINLLRELAGKNHAGDADAYSLVRLPSSAMVDEDALSSVAVAVTNASENFLPVSLSVVEKVEGFKDIVLSSPDLVVMTNRETQSSAGGAFNQGHGGDWTNGEVPSSGSARHYWLGASTHVTDDISLPESVLSVGATFNCTGGDSFTFREMNLCGVNMLFWSGAEERKFTAEKVHVRADSAIASSTPYVIFDAEFCGNGMLTLRNNDDGYGKLRFDRANTNYAGRVVVTQQGPNSDKSNITPYKFTLYVNDALGLGGKYGGDDSYRAITFSKFPTMNVQRSTSFSEPTRGILVQGGAQFTVGSTCTLTLSNQVTYAGVIQKSGSGILDLAGIARFIDGNPDTPPQATTNVIAVMSGGLRISSPNAADGLELRFSEGSKLLIPSDTAFGYRNVKWNVPLVVGTDSGKLLVVVEGLEAAADGGNVEVPICTFNATAAAGIAEDLFAVSTDADDLRFKHLKKVANEDGTVSYVAVFGRFGSRIVIR